MDFTNEQIGGVHISRYIASWLNVGGYLLNQDTSDFEDWLRSLSGENGNAKLTDEEIDRICAFAICGRMELEHSAEDFLRNMPTPFIGQDQIMNGEDPQYE